MSAIVRRRRIFCAVIQSCSIRGFQTILKGNDTHVPTLWQTLGFVHESEMRAMERTPEELRLGLVREAKKLSPSTNPEDQVKLQSLLKAYSTLRSSDRVAHQYAAHHSSSIDANLHVLVEGGEHGANFNPEHQAFDFSERAKEGVRNFGDITTDAYKNVEMGGAASTASKNPGLNASASRSCTTAEPRRGHDIPFTLRLSFDESIFGCEKVAVYNRAVRCRVCQGSGKKESKSGQRPPCAMCRGAGKVTLPSGTYLVEKPCSHCSGDGRQAAPVCGSCKGCGTSVRKERVPIHIAPGVVSGDLRTLHGKGDHGVRGGAVGDLKVSVVVEEHRVFRRIDNHLHIVLPIPLSTALLGGFVTAPSLKGPIQVRIPPNVRSGEIVTVSGAGVPSSASADKLDGSLMVHVVVVVPSASQLTGRQRSALEQFSSSVEERANSSSQEMMKSKEDATLLIRKGLEDMKTRFGAAWFRSPASY